MRRYFEKLKNKKDFERAYKNGRVIISKDYKIKAKVVIKPCSSVCLFRYGISVISIKGNSVWRNRLKRVIRDVVSKESITLQQTTSENKINIDVVFSPHSINQKNYSKIFYKDIASSYQDILNKLKLTLIQRQLL